MIKIEAVNQNERLFPILRIVFSRVKMNSQVEEMLEQHRWLIHRLVLCSGVGRFDDTHTE